MSINKKSNDATEKKGMALSDEALANVTGGKTYYAVEHGFTPSGVCDVHITADADQALKRGFGFQDATVVKFNFDGDLNAAEDYYRSVVNSPGFTKKYVLVSDVSGFSLHSGWDASC